MGYVEGDREIDIADLEAAINRCRHASSAGDRALARDLSLMADLYGLMIYRRARCTVIGDGHDALRAALTTWAGDRRITPASTAGDAPC